ncbi:MAG: flagellar brake protein [Synergistaceae bacterium]|jgi:c-di-GMP-binding flagellar brake protein YcgR|nr:flagellar brake protein [Synergistaceae bacterium]
MAKYADIPPGDYANKLQVGVKGEVVINAGIYKGHYATYIEDVKPDNMIGFAHPLMSGALLPVYRELEFDFIMEDGSAQYIFDMAVRRVEIHGNLSTMWAVLRDRPKRIQRRQFLRVPCLWNIFIFHTEYEKKEPMSAKWLPAHAINISLGGYRFKISQEDAQGLRFEHGDKILVFFELSGKQYMFSGSAMRIEYSGNFWEVGVSFDSLPFVMEKKLFEYIRQQELIWHEE